MMKTKNAKNRSSTVKRRIERGTLEGQPRSVGSPSAISGEPEPHEIGARREDRYESNTFGTGEQSINGIPGKILSQLIEETEKQLAYHEQQAEVLRERLKELKRVSEVNTIETE